MIKKLLILTFIFLLLLAFCSCGEDITTPPTTSDSGVPDYPTTTTTGILDTSNDSEPNGSGTVDTEPTSNTPDEDTADSYPIGSTIDGWTGNKK